VLVPFVALNPRHSGGRSAATRNPAVQCTNIGIARRVGMNRKGGVRNLPTHTAAFRANDCIAARLLQGAEIELLPMRFLFEAATRMSIEIDHPAYDCLYVALAVEKECSFVTADERFPRKLHQGRQPKLRRRAISLIEAVKL
jgi:hypothetical protein